MGKKENRETQNPKQQNKQHFIHHHILISLEPEEGEEIECEACEARITEPFHGCLSCKVYLHDICIDAPRYLDHPSHPSHPLTLLPTPTYHHRSFTCNACGLDGKAFSFCCAKCQFDIHVQCACMPNSVVIASHPHELQLIFGTPDQDNENVEFECDVCHCIMDRDRWLYYCSACDFGAHLGCTDRKGQRQTRNGQTYENSQVSRGGESSNRKEVGLRSAEDLQNAMFEAQRKLREQAIAHRVQLEALDNAADYVGSSYSTKYYYY